MGAETILQLSQLSMVYLLIIFIVLSGVLLTLLIITIKKYNLIYRTVVQTHYSLTALVDAEYLSKIFNELTEFRDLLEDDPQTGDKFLEIVTLLKTIEKITSESYGKCFEYDKIIEKNSKALNKVQEDLEEIKKLAT